VSGAFETRDVKILVAVAILAAALAGSVSAGDYSPPPGDCCPQWSPNGTQLVFSGNRGAGPAVGVVGANGGPEAFVAGIPIGLRSPDWRYVAYTKDVGSEPWLAVSSVDGSDEHLIARVSGSGDFA